MLGNLIRIGALVGAGYAAAKIGDKVKENSDGAPRTAGEKITAVKAAAGEFASETMEKLNEKAPGVKNVMGSAVQKVSDFAAEKAPVAADKVQKMVEKAADKAPGLAEKVQLAVEKVADKASSVADVISADKNFQEVVDAAEEDAEAVSEEET